MKALQVKQYGGTDGIAVSEVDRPVIGEGQLLIEVYSSAINPFDIALRNGIYKDVFHLNLPFTLGGDFSGVIREVGSGIKNFEEGDAVYGQASVVAGNSGSMAELLVTSVDQVGRKPLNTSFSEAASLPLVGVSALQAMTDSISVQSGQKLLIHGSGGIGTVALQIARNRGATVTITTRNKNDVYRLKDLGADEVINTHETPLEKIDAKFDATLDTVGGDDFVKICKLLRTGSPAISMVTNVDLETVLKSGIKAQIQSTKVNNRRLEQLRELVESDVVKPQIGQVFPYTDYAEAFQVFENREVKGKVILQFKAD